MSGSPGAATGVSEVARSGAASAALVQQDPAAELVAGMLAEPAGRSSPSVYETGRLVSLAPWLARHEERIAWLVDRQRPDGAWGGPEGYALVPTLSATEALLAVLDRGDHGGVGRERLARAVHDGLTALYDRLAGPAAPPPPDLPATDLIVPALTELLAAHLDTLGDRPVDVLARWRGARPLPLPAGMDRARLDGVRLLHAAGRPLPEKLAHALEVLGPPARRAAGFGPVGPGTVGASPAATAAWLGAAPDRDEPGRAYLEDLVRQYGGPVPAASPIAVFERSWVLGTLSRAGVPVRVPAALTDELRDALGPAGAPTGPGLPADADTTSATLYALARLGRPVDPTVLRPYDTGEHFCTWPGEDGASVTTNAHVLDALGHLLPYGGPAVSWLDSAVRRLTGWLLDRQETHGAWTDRWHASPYYATCCAALALADHGRTGHARHAVERAARWVVDTQRPDGSWGRWGGSAEETAYAVQTLVAAGHRPGSPLAAAIGRGAAWLSTADVADDGPELWHDKDLYRPTLIVRATVHAARRLARDGGRDA
ncbi:prenyltransferase/squalene oxidase repeat-containing protein [Micromonospora costi]|uniref:prenyltransferase/squalene oxidase repeat-containing protein n=1 Tax=Micromonospora costi TaxID=1530042 RepID=UPI003403D7FD